MGNYFKILVTMMATTQLHAAAVDCAECKNPLKKLMTEMRQDIASVHEEISPTDYAFPWEDVNSVTEGAFRETWNRFRTLLYHIAARNEAILKISKYFDSHMMDNYLIMEDSPQRDEFRKNYLALEKFIASLK